MFFPEDFAARLGGDEFVICICRNLDVSELEELANDLQKNGSAPVLLIPREFKTSPFP